MGKRGKGIGWAQQEGEGEWVGQRGRRVGLEDKGERGEGGHSKTGKENGCARGEGKGWAREESG